MNKGKIILIAILLLMFSTAVFAQGITAKGIKGGLNLANWTGDDADFDFDGGYGNKKMRTGFVFGGFITYEMNEMFSLQPELLFTMKGAKYEDEYTEEEDNYEYYEKTEISMNCNYLEIPVLAKLKIPMEGNIKPNVFLGPALSIALSTTYDVDFEYKEYEDGQLVDEESGSVDADIEFIKDVDFGLVFGAGVDFGKITVDARYNMGLSSIADEDEDDVKIKNSVISIMLGYAF